MADNKRASSTRIELFPEALFRYLVKPTVGRAISRA